MGTTTISAATSKIRTTQHRLPVSADATTHADYATRPASVARYPLART
jgi:hypothetical protein